MEGRKGEEETVPVETGGGEESETRVWRAKIEEAQLPELPPLSSVKGGQE